MYSTNFIHDYDAKEYLINIIPEILMICVLYWYNSLNKDNSGKFIYIVVETNKKWLFVWIFHQYLHSLSRINSLVVNNKAVVLFVI